MITFKQFLDEIYTANPYKLLKRFSDRYGVTEHDPYAEEDEDVNGFRGETRAGDVKRIYLGKYNPEESDDVFDAVSNAISNSKGNSVTEKSKNFQDSGEKNKRKFKISDLNPGQEYVRVDDLHRLNKKIEKRTGDVKVVKHRNKLFVINGHHEILGAKLRGEKEIEAHYHDLDKE